MGPNVPIRKQARAIQQAVELQSILMEKARDSETTASAAAQVARAWCECESMKRVLRNKPNVKPVDVDKITKPKSAKSPVNTFTETPVS